MLNRKDKKTKLLSAAHQANCKEVGVVLGGGTAAAEIDAPRTIRVVRILRPGPIPIQLSIRKSLLVNGRLFRTIVAVAVRTIMAFDVIHPLAAIQQGF